METLLPVRERITDTQSHLLNWGTLQVSYLKIVTPQMWRAVGILIKANMYSDRNDPQAELTGSGGDTEGLLLARVHDYHKILVTHTRAVKFEIKGAPGQKSHIYQLA